MTQLEQIRRAAHDNDNWESLPRDGAGNPVGAPTPDPLIAPGDAWEKRSAGQSLPAAASGGAAPVDTTLTTLALMQGLLSVESDTEAQLIPDACLLDWATASLQQFDGVTFSGVKDVCGGTAAVMAGGYSVGPRDLKLHALYAPDRAEREALSKILFGPPSIRWASVATPDGKAVLLVAAPGEKVDGPVVFHEPVVEPER